MIPKIKMISNRVLVKQDTALEQTASGILLAYKEEPRSTKGTIVAVGPGTKDHKMETKVGDHVLYNHDSGIEVLLEDGCSYLIMRETEIKMIL